MTTDLSGVDLKIGRAKAHLAKLKKSVKRALDPERYTFTLKFDPQTKKYPYWVDRIPTIKPEWNLVIGEILFNLRSALDHLAWQLVILDGGTPGEQTYFPIRDSPFNKKGKFITTNLRPSIKDAKILTELEECQPYFGPEGMIYPPPHDESLLWLLHRLNIIDKHRLLLVVACVLDTGQMWWDSPETPAPVARIETGVLKDSDSPIAFFDFHGKEPPPDFNPNPTLSITFDEGEMPAIKLAPYDIILDQLCGCVETDILGRFRPLFPQPS
jgi:hypothetical protein